MVWGMALPKGFGEDWPDGTFEKKQETGDNGWYDRLTEYYAQQTPEEKERLYPNPRDPSRAARAYGFYPVGKFKKEPGWSRKDQEEPSLGNVEPHEVPRSFNTVKTYKSLASLIKLSDMLLAVDERLKVVIDRLEPGVHEFFPFALTMPKGKQYPEQYYILRIRQYFDAFSREETHEGSVRVIPAYDDVPELIEVNTTKKALNGLAVREDAFSKAHLWRDRTFEEQLTCFSDELIAEVEKTGLRLPKHFKLKEV